MSRKIYQVDLSAEERADLKTRLSKGKASARALTRVRILLLSDDGRTDEQVADALGTSVPTVQRTRKRFVLEGVDVATDGRPCDHRRPTKLDGDGEAALTQLACSEPPKGFVGWTLRLLADRLVELRVVDSISTETVRRQLKKRSQALASSSIVHSEARCGVRLRDGGRAADLSTGEAGRRWRAPRRLRVSPQRHVQLIPAVCALAGVTACEGDRIPDRESLAVQVDAWQQARYARGELGDWRFAAEDARIRLRSLYPSIPDC